MYQSTYTLTNTFFSFEDSKILNFMDLSRVSFHHNLYFYVKSTKFYRISITQLVLRMYKLFITIAIKRIICVSRCVFSNRSAIIRGHHIIPPFAVRLWYRIASVLACHRFWFKYIFMKLSNEPSKPKLNFLFRIKYVTPFFGFPSYPCINRLNNLSSNVTIAKLSFNILSNIFHFKR